MATVMIIIRRYPTLGPPASTGVWWVRLRQSFSATEFPLSDEFADATFIADRPTVTHLEMQAMYRKGLMDRQRMNMFRFNGGS